MADQPTKNVYDDIQSKADYYSPDTYYKLLTYNTSLSLTPDAVTDFIPVSQTTPNTKLFIIGLLPPAANISGRLLDRSATVASQLGAPSGVDITGAFQTTTGSGGTRAGTTGSADRGRIVTADGYTIPLGTGSVGIGPAPSGTPPGAPGDPPTFSNYSVQDLWKIGVEAYQQLYGHDPTPTEMQFYVAQMLRETGGKIPNNNFGFVGNYGDASGNGGNVFYNAGTKTYFNTYPDPVSGVKGFLGHVAGNDNARYSAQQGDALGYATSLAQTGYFGEPINVYYGSDSGQFAGVFPRLLTQVAQGMAGTGVSLGDGKGLPLGAPDSCAFKENIFQYRARIGGTPALTSTNLFRFKTGSVYDDSCPLGVDGTTANVGSQAILPQPPTWASSGSAAASDAKKEQALIQDHNLNQTELGKALSAAQQAEIYATQQALNNMKNTPPLKMLVNPTSFKVASEKLISDGSWTRNGPIVEHWGDGQDKIDFSGRIAGIMAIDTQTSNDPNNPDAVGGPGLTRVSRNYTAAYQNLLSLWLLYRNNGYLYLQGLDASKVNSGKTVNRLSLVGSVYIFYDGILYIGSFDSFNMTEAEEKPYSIDYSITFTVRAAFLLDEPIDPQESYGPQAAQFFSTQDQINTSNAAKDAQAAADATAANKKLADDAAAAAAKADAELKAAKDALAASGTDPRFAGDVPLGPSTKFGGGPGGGTPGGLPGSSDPFGFGAGGSF